MKVEIMRVSVIEPGAFGVLLIDEIPIAVTLERTYKSVASGQVMKIPVGIHRCTETNYHKGNYRTFEIHVPEHKRILFHKGNVEDDLDGCIAIGEEFGRLHGKPAILRSGKGFDEFMRKMESVIYFDIWIYGGEKR